MNVLRSREARKKIATGLAIVAGSVGLSGCGIFNEAGLKPETKQQLAEILKPSVVRAGRLTLEYVRRHKVNTYITEDGNTEGGYNVQANFSRGDRDYVSVSVGMKKQYGDLDPDTTYEVEVESSYMLNGEQRLSEDDIYDSEEATYGDPRKIWFAANVGDVLSSDKKSVPGGYSYIDTHIEHPNNAHEVDTSLLVAGDEINIILDTIDAEFSAQK